MISAAFGRQSSIYDTLAVLVACREAYDSSNAAALSGRARVASA
jgi:hypothetical protein